METEKGLFTAEEFRKRAISRSFSGHGKDPYGADGKIIRGDHDLNPEISGMIAAGEQLRPAAVLIPVLGRAPGATVILTLRTLHLPSHAGQISFPGGKMSEGDTSPIDTALREAHEEIGLAPEFVEPIGLLEAYRSGSGFSIVPVLAIVSEKCELVVNEDEVAELFEVPLEFLMTVANHQRHSVEWQGKQRQYYAMPFGERYIWGATAGIIRIMYERLYAE